MFPSLLRLLRPFSFPRREGSNTKKPGNKAATHCHSLPTQATTTQHWCCCQSYTSRIIRCFTQPPFIVGRRREWRQQAAISAPSEPCIWCHHRHPSPPTSFLNPAITSFYYCNKSFATNINRSLHSLILFVKPVDEEMFFLSELIRRIYAGYAFLSF